MQAVDDRIHPLVAHRLLSLQRALMALFDAGAIMSYSSRGTERELFVSSFLRQLYPPSVRFDSGDITDINRIVSGQVDIIVEAPTLFSLPATLGGPRLFLAEGVAAAIEVKSNLSSQWDEVVAKSSAIKKLIVLERKYSTAEKLAMAHAMHPDRKIKAVYDSPVDAVHPKTGGVPFIAIGFDGWSELDTVRAKAADVGAVFVLRHAIYAGPSGSSVGAMAIFMFLEYLSSLIQSASVTIHPTWHYGMMSSIHRDHPGLLIE